MTKDHEEKEPAFKVVDRRRFTEDGHQKTDVPVEEKPSSTEPLEEPKKDALKRPDMSFLLFIQSLATQAMMGLGIVPWPDSGLVRKELELAKETIDILSILKEKTVNNLKADEQKMLDSLLYQLRLAYVEIANLPGDGPLIK